MHIHEFLGNCYQLQVLQFILHLRWLLYSLYLTIFGLIPGTVARSIDRI